MAWSFGDSWDLYATPADAINGYWDTMTGSAVNYSLVTGRFAGSRALQCATLGMNLIKNSGQNDAVHHIVCAFYQTAALSGTSLATYFSLGDGATAQCSVVFRSDGAILLTSGGPAGTALDTYTGAVTANNTWYAFEFEVVINNTTGSWAVRKNGNTSNDRALGSLDTQNSANAYANRLTFGVNASVSQQVDDLFWQSGASTGTWLGDIRCYTRMPASDVGTVQFARTAGATNASCVDEPQQNSSTDYVFDSTPGDADFYSIGSIASTPVTTFAVVTRGYMQKSDAGTRTAAVQIKSGGTTVASPTLVLTTSGWLWAWRLDLTDPATSAAWTAAGVNAVNIGPLTVA